MFKIESGTMLFWILNVVVYLKQSRLILIVYILFPTVMNILKL